LPFLPVYIGFGVGSEKFALSLKRILLLILFISLVLSFTQNREYISQRISQVYQQNKLLINLLLLFSVLKVVSLSLGSRALLQYIMLFNDFLLTGFAFMLTIILITSEEHIHHMAKIFFYGYIVVLILVFIESFVKFPLFGIFISGEMNLHRDYTDILERGGGYRANGSFVSPIALGEYLVILFPVVVAYIYRHKYSLILKVIFYILFLYAIYSTRSRSAILMSAVMIYFYLFFMFYRGNQFSRFIVNILTLIVVSIAIYLVFNYISDLIMNFHGRFDLLGGDDTVISSTARALQFINVYNKILEAPFFGFGRLVNFSDFLGSSIDSRYFWMIMEVGIVGISVYFLFLFTLVKIALNLYKLPHKNYYTFPLLLSILLYIPYKTMAVGPTNLIYIYIFAGLISVMKVLQNEQRVKY